MSSTFPTYEPQAPAPSSHWGARSAFGVAVLASIGLSFLPYDLYNKIAYPLMLFSTFAHEMGHGLTALLLGGVFDRFEMTPDGAGVAFTATNGALKHAIVCAGGLVGPAVLGAIYFRMGRDQKLARAALYLLAAFCAIAIVLWVRNPFGLMFTALLGFAAFVVAQFSPSDRVVQAVTAFLAVQLSVCVYTRGDYLFTASAGNGPSDVAQMADALLLPYPFWGAVCALFSAVVLWRGVRGMLRAGS